MLALMMMFGCLINMDSSSNYRSLDMRREIDGRVEIELIQRDDLFAAPITAPPAGADAEEDFVCDRSHYRTDVCELKGDVRIDGSSDAVMLYSPERQGSVLREEKIRPYTRKWEKSVMDTIDEVSLRRVGNCNLTAAESRNWLPECEVRHEVPAVVFSTGGYTGNVYHEFNDGLIPLFISSQHLRGEVVLVILEYHNWWETKYEAVLKQLTRYQVLDVARDKRVHCFPEAMVGLRIHDELAIEPALMNPPASMADFQQLLRHAYYNPALNQTLMMINRPIINLPKSSKIKANISKRPKLVIISRKRPRALLNQRNVKSLAQRIGFEVEILSPTSSMEMSHVFRILNACDMMLGVHGAAMTHLLFMRPGTTFMQVVPLGTDWAAHTYYGEPATKLGLHYVPYKVAAKESSLWEKYGPDDPVVTDPDAVNSKGWWETKKIYLNGQDVRLSLQRLRPLLRSAYTRALTQLRKSHER